jgi:DNA-binding NarL/FixJ family response regulator
MTVLVFEDNLMWSVRLANAARTLGHDPIVMTTVAEEAGGEVAIVNLSARAFDPAEVVATLRSRGVKVVGHAGHKEKDLLQEGVSSGCDLVVTNSEIAHKLSSVLERATASPGPSRNA